MSKSGIRVQSVHEWVPGNPARETDNSFLNPTKYFLRVINPDQSELTNYRQAIDSSWCTDVNLSALTLLSDEKLGQFYGHKVSDKPRYVDIHSHADCYRLAQSFNKSFIIYERRKLRWYKHYDGRCAERAHRESAVDRPVLCFFIIYKSAGAELHLANPETFVPLRYPESSENAFVEQGTYISLHDDDYLQAIYFLLHGHSSKTFSAKSIVDICDVTKKKEYMNFLQVECLFIVTHVKSVMGKTTRVLPETQRFSILTILREVDSSIHNISNASVVSICESGFMYVPKLPFRSYIKDRQKLFRETLFKGFPTKKTRLPPHEEKVSPCPCAVCLDGKKYIGNMSIDGPQALFKSNLDSWEYLHWLNLDTEENRQNIRRACDLSVSSFDLESKTLKLTPATVDAVPMECVGWYRHQTGLRFSQKAILFAHLDSKEITTFSGESLSTEGECTEHDSTMEEIKIFRVPNNLNETINDYIDYLQSRQKWASALKREILKDLFLFLTRMKEAHLAHFSSHEIEIDVAEAAWNATILGKFEKHLELLVKNYFCISFNGANYDNILLAPAFAVALKERKVFFSKLTRKKFKVDELQNRFFFRIFQKFRKKGTQSFL